MFSSLKSLPATALALVLIASPAYAADVSAEGATVLKAMIQSHLDQRRDLHMASGSQLITEGELKVETADGFYAVTLPHIKVKDASGFVVDIGMFAANVIPGDNPKEWKASVAIPTPIHIIDEAGKPLMNIAVGKQRAVGIWDVDLGAFIRFDGEYGDIVAQSNSSADKLTANKATLRTLLKRDESTGMLSGPSTGIISDMTLNLGSESAEAKIKDMGFDVTIKDFDPKVAKSFNQQLGALGQNGQTIVDAAGSTGTQSVALYNMLTEVIGKSSDAFSTNFTINGLSFTSENVETKAKETFELGTAGFGFDMSGFRAGSVKLGLRFNYGGLKLANDTDPYKDLVPFSTKLDLSINKLPFTQLVDLGRTTLSSTGGDPNAAQMAGLTAMMTVPKLLTDAGTNLTHTLESTATSFKTESKGVVSANINAILGYTSEQDLTFKGLDGIIARINEEMKNPENPEAQRLQSVLGPLTILQMVGQKDASDPDLRTYRLIVDDKGKMMLNGSDMSTLMGGAGGGEVTTPIEKPKLETE